MGACKKIWGWDGTNWYKVIVDGAGHLQVDVLTAALPAGGATAANQVLIIADLATLIAGQGQCYGWDGAAWQKLLVDAATNLQVDVNEVRKTNTATIAQVTVGVASTAVLAANANRIFAEFVNDSTVEIYLGLGAAAVMNKGIRLNAKGGSFEIGLTNLYTGAVKAISGVAASNLTVSEG